MVNKNLDFAAMQYENVDPAHVETLTHVHGQAEDFEYMEKEVELRSEAEDGNHDIELSDKDSD